MTSHLVKSILSLPELLSGCPVWGSGRLGSKRSFYTGQVHCHFRSSTLRRSQGHARTSHKSTCADSLVCRRQQATDKKTDSVASTHYWSPRCSTWIAEAPLRRHRQRETFCDAAYRTTTGQPDGGLRAKSRCQRCTASRDFRPRGSAGVLPPVLQTLSLFPELYPAAG